MSRIEKFIQDCTKNFSNYIERDLDGFSYLDYVPWLTPDEAMKAAKIAREETINEVCEWIKYNNENGGCLFDGWENDLKKHLNSKV